ncbi:hypothetical protein C922_05758 [Plasmodium inui San Antonio 1]|uniref:Uncharacterized protein n=1 Tax=Plasmodium inui San Antonio 1 TaxID=1237626 RepID=W6ZX30_9APIC|nr:hypothetical protein C922_05758 [Plasmodium inui San Antonio 1]EUD63858.1 hypothetical protein C922_05758 [Plasmodium inui San Antonio 1]
MLIKYLNSKKSGLSYVCPPQQFREGNDSSADMTMKDKIKSIKEQHVQAPTLTRMIRKDL